MHLCLLPSQVYDFKTRGHCSRSARVWQAVLKNEEFEIKGRTQTQD